MTRLLGPVLFALVLGLGGLAGTAPAHAEAVRVEGVAPFSFADVVEEVRPAVVTTNE